MNFTTLAVFFVCTIFLYTTATEVVVRGAKSIPNDAILDIATDIEGNVYTLTQLGGAFQLHSRRPDGQSISYITCYCGTCSVFAKTLTIINNSTTPILYVGGYFFGTGEAVLAGQNIPTNSNVPKGFLMKVVGKTLPQQTAQITVFQNHTVDMIQSSNSTSEPVLYIAGTYFGNITIGNRQITARQPTKSSGVLIRLEEVGDVRTLIGYWDVSSANDIFAWKELIYIGEPGYAEVAVAVQFIQFSGDLFTHPDDPNTNYAIQSSDYYVFVFNGDNSTHPIIAQGPTNPIIKSYTGIEHYTLNYLPTFQTYYLDMSVGGTLTYYLLDKNLENPQSRTIDRLFNYRSMQFLEGKTQGIVTGNKLGVNNNCEFEISTRNAVSTVQVPLELPLKIYQPDSSTGIFCVRPDFISIVPTTDGTTKFWSAGNYNSEKTLKFDRFGPRLPPIGVGFNAYVVLFELGPTVVCDVLKQPVSQYGITWSCNNATGEWVGSAGDLSNQTDVQLNFSNDTTFEGDLNLPPSANVTLGSNVTVTVENNVTVGGTLNVELTDDDFTVIQNSNNNQITLTIFESLYGTVDGNFTTLNIKPPKESTVDPQCITAYRDTSGGSRTLLILIELQPQETCSPPAPQTSPTPVSPNTPPTPVSPDTPPTVTPTNNVIDPVPVLEGWAIAVIVIAGVVVIAVILIVLFFTKLRSKVLPYRGTI